MSLLQYLLRYFSRRRLRAVLTISGVSLAISAIVFAYGLSGWVESYSSRSLAQVIDNQKIWIVPSGGVKLDPSTGLIVPQGFVSEDTIRLFTGAEIAFKRVVAGPLVLRSEHVVLYGDERITNSGLLVSSDLWAMIDRHATTISINGEDVTIAQENTTLPPRSVITSLQVGKRVLRIDDGASWLLSDDPRAVSWARGFGKANNVRVSSDPTPGADGTRANIYLLEGTVARFDPFTFRTKFSALTINSSLTTMFGLTSRLVFLLGVALAITSSLITLRERRDEIALFSVAGLQSGVSLLFLLEACLNQILCLILGSAVGLALLSITLGGALRIELATQSVAFGIVYLPVLIVLTTIIPSQVVASRRPVDLVRGTL